MQIGNHFWTRPSGLRKCVQNEALMSLLFLLGTKPILLIKGYIYTHYCVGQFQVLCISVTSDPRLSFLSSLTANLALLEWAICFTNFHVVNCLLVYIFFLPLLYDVNIICNEFGIPLRKKFYNILLEGQCLGTSKKWEQVVPTVIHVSGRSEVFTVND